MKTIEVETKEDKSAPTPNIIINQSKREIDLISKENDPFLLNMSKSKDNIIFTAKKKDSHNNIQYIKVASLKDFYDSNKYYYQYETIEELFTQFILDLQNNEIEISFDNNNVNMTINVEIRKKRIQTVLILKPEETNIDRIISNLSNEIDLLKIENMELKQSIEELKKINQDQIEGNINQRNFNERFNKDINSLDNDIFQLKDYYSHLKKKMSREKEEYTQQINKLKNEFNELKEKINLIVSKTNEITKNGNQEKKVFKIKIVYQHS